VCFPKTQHHCPCLLLASRNENTWKHTYVLSQSEKGFARGPVRASRNAYITPYSPPLFFSLSTTLLFLFPKIGTLHCDVLFSRMDIVDGRKYACFPKTKHHCPCLLLGSGDRRSGRGLCALQSPKDMSIGLCLLLGSGKRQMSESCMPPKAPKISANVLLCSVPKRTRLVAMPFFHNDTRIQGILLALDQNYNRSPPMSALKREFKVFHVYSLSPKVHN
jgi:hypothetical protein